MIKTTREFASLLKAVIGLPAHKECWSLVAYVYACFGIKLSLRNPASFTKEDITFLNKIVFDRPSTVKAGSNLVTVEGEVSYTYTSDKADPSSLMFWEEVEFKNKQFLDVLLFGKYHVGLVLDDTYFIHAEHVVMIDKYKQNYRFVSPVKVYRLCQ